MPKHHSEDYKISAVQYYLDNKTTYSNVCKIFKCSGRSLKRWIEKYKKDKYIKRYDRKSISYKITKEQVKYAIKKLKENQQITMNELVKLLKRNIKILILHLNG
jgi:transposase